MAIRKYNPTSPGTRFQTVAVFDEITTQEPHKPLVEQMLGAKVDTVRTCMAHGKIKRQGRFAGRRPDWKKAYVKLREGAKMPEFLEGA